MKKKIINILIKNLKKKKKDIESHIVSLDVNSLHPTVMTYKLPYGKFNYNENTSKYTTEYILNLVTDGDYFYIFVIDISCPKNMYDKFEELKLIN